MCGIVGILDTVGARPIDRGLLAAMNDTQAHRGPDAAGLYTGDGIGLGHRRLSIIDLAGGQQPLFNEDGSVVVIFNGEIYNFQALTRELQAAGHRFATHSDTEAIVHAWEEWGEACVDRFRGMFAFAIWDSRTRTLFLARDRLGIKPLYYACLDDGTFLFASELKGVLRHPGLPRTLDVCAIEDYFAYGYVPDPRTIYSGVAKLPPGHTLTVRPGASRPAPRQFWNLAFAPRDDRSERQLCDEFHAQLREAVRLRLIAEVPLGAFLSGGVDSSAVVATMAGLSASPVVTCSIAFGEEAYDEARYARMVADRYQTDHKVRAVDPTSFDLIDRLVTVYDEPFADSSAIPTYRVCELGREHVTVALSGDGGDEAFAGYTRYRWLDQDERVRRRVPRSLRRPLFGLLGDVLPGRAAWGSTLTNAKATLQSLARDLVDGYFHEISVIKDADRNRLYAPALRRALQGYRAIDVLRGHMDAAPADDPVARVQYADFKTYLPGDILTKVDRASMAHALEVRVPILDHVLLEWAATVPTRMKLRGQEGKYLMKKALEPLLPHEVMYRRKMGFAVPIAEWFRGPLQERVRAALTGPRLLDTGLFDRTAIAGLIDDHVAGTRDHSNSLWALLMFESFLRQVHDVAAAPAGGGPPAPAGDAPPAPAALEA